MKWLLIAPECSPSYAGPYEAWLARNGCESLRCLPSEWSARQLDNADALLLIGGGDVDPRRYHAERHPATRDPDAARDEAEIQALLAARGMGKPVLGICRGMQVAAVALGGSLIQHVPDPVDETIERHRANDDGSDAFHPLNVCTDRNLGQALGGVTRVNSAHHQSLDPAAPGQGLRVVAQSPRGIIEAAEADSGALLWLVQWHPERLPPRDPAGDGMLRAFVQHMSLV